MLCTRVRAGETLNMLSARLGRPACMILRANRLFSPAWLLPGREIAVPPRDFCLRDAGECPCAAVMHPAGKASMRRFYVRAGQSVGELARAAGLPERMVLSAARGRLAAGRALDLPVPPDCSRIITVQPGDTVEDICRRYGMAISQFAAVNRIGARLWPGMRIIVAQSGDGLGR